MLGPLEVQRDGQRVPVPTGKPAELLARLAVDVGRSVRVEVLLDDLWSEPTARNTLQSKVSMLRRALGRDLIRASDDGYLLDLPPDAVDATVATRLAQQSTAARHSGELARCLDQAGEGLRWFRGEPLVDAGLWAAPYRSRLNEVRLQLMEDLVAARVGLGAGSELVGELQDLTRSYPLREGFWAALIIALYRAGRQAEALTAYQQVRRLLIDKLGVEPGPELQSIHKDLLQQRVSRAADTDVRRSRPGNLTLPVGLTVGRDEDITAVLEALHSSRLVSLLGAAGVGKTRLAMLVTDQVRHAAGGVWFVRLDGADGTVPLWQLVAETLHVRVERGALRDRLNGAETVLVIDNCEHLVAPAAALVESLLAEAPGLRVLATSQVPLGLATEVRHQLAPLSHDDSVALFTARASQTRRQFAIDAQVEGAVDLVCRRLDGLPLAIELAAARVRSLSVHEIARRLDDRFALLTDPTSARSDRHRTLAGAIGWSYDLLFPDDQRALWALACFAGGASLDGILAVLAALDVPATAAVDSIARLVDRSLLTIDELPGGNVRYRLLDSIRVFTLDRLAESRLAHQAATGWAEWYATLGRWCEEHVRTRGQLEVLPVVRVERPNIDAVLGWCAEHRPELGLQIADDFGWAWVVLGEGTAAAARIRATQHEDAADEDRFRGHLLAAWLESSAGNVAIAADDLTQARTLLEPDPDERLQAQLAQHEAFVAIQQGDAEHTVAAASSAAAVARRHGSDWDLACSLLLGAYGSIMRGDLDKARTDCEEAMMLLAPIGDPWGLVHGQAIRAAIAQAEHRFDDAARALLDAADTPRTSGFAGQAALHRANLARVQHRAGLDEAPTTYKQAIDEAVAVGDGRLAASTRLQLARWHRSRGADGVALELLEQNQRWYLAAGGGDYALLNEALAAAIRSDIGELRAVLARGRAQGNAEVVVHCLDALARLAATSGDPAEASVLLTEADAVAARVAYLLDPVDRTDAVQAWLKLGTTG